MVLGPEGVSVLCSVRCRNRAGSKVGRIATILGIVALVVASPTTALADDIDIRDVMDGKVEGLTVQVNGSGLGYYGDSLRATFVNTTDQPMRVKVPIGLRFLPNDRGVQTMISAGDEIIVVPPGDSESLLKAFCGEMNDSAPGAADVFTSGELVTGDLLSTVRNLNQEGRFDSTGNNAVWKFTDDLSLEGDPEAQRLVKTSTSAARTAAGGALTGAVIAGGAIIQARTVGTGRRSAGPPPTRKDVLVDTEATKWLVDDGAKTITHDGKTYVLPPARMPPNTDGVAFETITINGVDVIDENKVAVIPHRKAPVTPPQSPPPPAKAPVPAEATSDTAVPTTPATKQPDNVKLTRPEQQHIIEWGVKNQRTPDEIQKDLDAQNETSGGSGTVPAADMPVRLKLPQGDVTVTAAEAAAYKHQIANIEAHNNQIKNTRRELVFWRQQIEKWVDYGSAVEARFAGGMFELFRQRNRMENPGEYLRKMHNESLGDHEKLKTVEDLLIKKYNQPEYMMDYDRWQGELRRWEQGPDAARYNEHCDNIKSTARDTIYQMTSVNPTSSSLASPFNRAAIKITEYNKHRETLIETVRVVNAKKATLREMEKLYAARIKKAP